MSNAPVVSVTDELIAELEQLATKATPGPWVLEADEDSCMAAVYLVSAIKQYPQPIARLSGWHDQKYLEAANPAIILALLAEREELKRTVGQLEARLMLADAHRASTVAICMAEVSAIVSKAGDNARDAERYRWLRDNWFQIYGESKGRDGIRISIGDIWNHAGVPAHVDAAIDAAMQS